MGVSMQLETLYYIHLPMHCMHAERYNTYHVNSRVRDCNYGRPFLLNEHTI